MAERMFPGIFTPRWLVRGSTTVRPPVAKATRFTSSTPGGSTGIAVSEIPTSVLASDEHSCHNDAVADKPATPTSPATSLLDNVPPLERDELPSPYPLSPETPKDNRVRMTFGTDDKRKSVAMSGPPDEDGGADSDYSDVDNVTNNKVGSKTRATMQAATTRGKSVQTAALSPQNIVVLGPPQQRPRVQLADCCEPHEARQE